MKSIFYAVIIILVGALLGNFIGKLLVIWFPTGNVRELFANQLTTGLAPANVDLGVMDVTFGCMFKLNITGVLGIVLAAIGSKSLFK